MARGRARRGWARALLAGGLLVATQVQAVDSDAVRALVADPAHAAAPGCAVAAFRGGAPVLSVSAGLADLERERPIDGRTVFYAASVSKQFTALVVAQLAVEGTIDLDADVRRYLPELPAYAHTVTPRMLLHHTAGVPDWLMLAALSGASDWSTLDARQIMALITAQPQTAFVPGSRYAYSNSGYRLLAVLVERVTGTPFAERVRTHVFEPLGMRDAFVLDGARPTGANVAHGYVPVGDGFEVRDTYPLVSGSGGVMLSVEDLARYEHDIEVGHRVWTAPVRALMWTPARLSDGGLSGAPDGLGYAGGLRIGQRLGQRVIQHAGGAEAFRLQYLRLPDRGLAVAVLCNRGDRDPVPLADTVAAMLEGDTLWSSTAQAAARVGDYTNAALSLRYRIDAIEADDRLHATVFSPLTPAAGEPQGFRPDDAGGYVAEDPVRSIRLRFQPEGAALRVSMGDEVVRLLRVAE